VFVFFLYQGADYIYSTKITVMNNRKQLDAFGW